jgi:NitT/TauT family transport system permease protein
LINRLPSPGLRLGLALIPLLLIAVVYMTASMQRLAVNADDKLLPSPLQMIDAVERMAFEPDTRSGRYLFWSDTGASLRRLGIGLGLSAVIGIVLGIAAGTLPLVAAPMSPLVATLSMIPPLAILPILFIVFGLDELSKVMLITIGVAPMIVRDLEGHANQLPREQIIKALTLGANSWTTILRVVLPQLLPRLVIALRLQLGCAWLFLISAEAIAATEGLGYRIFLMRRYLSMDVILPYVAWITLLAYSMDWLLRLASARLFPWFEEKSR